MQLRSVELISHKLPRDLAAKMALVVHSSNPSWEVEAKESGVLTGKDSSMVKSTGCTCRGVEYSF